MLGFRVQGVGFRVQGVQVYGLGFRAWGFGVSGLWLKLGPQAPMRVMGFLVDQALSPRS